MLFFSPRRIDLSSGTNPMLNSLSTPNQATANPSVKTSSQTVSSMRNVSLAVSEHSSCSNQNPLPTSGQMGLKIRPIAPKQLVIRPSIFIPQDGNSRPLQEMGRHRFTSEMFFVNPSLGQGAIHHNKQLASKDQVSILPVSSQTPQIRMGNLTPEVEIFTKPRPVPVLMPPQSNSIQTSVAPNVRYRKIMPMARSGSLGFVSVRPMAYLQTDMQNIMQNPPARMEIPPARMEIPPARMEIPPARMEIPPVRMEIPPVRMEIPPARMVIPPARMEIPPARMETSPARMASSPPRIGMPPLRMGNSSLKIVVPPARMGNPSGRMGGPSLPTVQVTGPKLFPKPSGSSQNLTIRQIAPAPNQWQFPPRPTVSSTSIFSTTASYRDKVQAFSRQNIQLPHHPVPQDFLRHPNSGNIRPSSNVINIPSSCTSFPTFTTSQQSLSTAALRIPNGGGLASHITNLQPSQQALYAVTSHPQSKQNSQFLVLNQSNAKGTLQVFQSTSHPTGQNQGSTQQILPAPSFSTGNQTIDPTKNFLSKICRVTTAQNKDSENGIKPTNEDNNNLSTSRSLLIKINARQEKTSFKQYFLLGN